MGARAAHQHRPAAEGHRHPDPAAPGAARRMARRGSVGAEEPGVLGRASGGRRGQGRLLRLDVLQRRRRRHQHQRVHRGRGRRQAGPHGAAARRVARQPGGHAALPLSVERQRRLAARRALVRGASDAAGRTRWRRRAGETRRRAASWKGSCGRTDAARPQRRDSWPRSRRPARCRHRRASAGRSGRGWRSWRCIRSRRCWRCTCARSHGASARGTGWSSSCSDSAPWPCGESSSSPSIIWAPPASNASRRPRWAARR